MSSRIHVKDGTAIEGEALCKTCLWVHMQKGFRESEELIACNYGHPMRRMPFKVRECSGYTDRMLPDREAMEEMALLIHVAPARRRVGFANPGGLPDQKGAESPNAIAAKA